MITSAKNYSYKNLSFDDICINAVAKIAETQMFSFSWTMATKKRKCGSLTNLLFDEDYLILVKRCFLYIIKKYKTNRLTQIIQCGSQCPDFLNICIV